jgi:hypothetical protein
MTQNNNNLFEEFIVGFDDWIQLGSDSVQWLNFYRAEYLRFVNSGNF